MSLLLWVHDHFWWLALAVVPCLAAVGWALWAGRYQPVHAAAPHRTYVLGEGWVPWDTDPRFGSMQLDADRALTAYELGIPVGPDMAWREMVALGEDIGEVPPWPDAYQERVTWAMDAWQPPTVPPLSWREVAHEGDWRAQTAADLAPAVLAAAVLDQEVMPSGPENRDALGRISSGPGGTSLAPGPDPLAVLDAPRGICPHDYVYDPTGLSGCPICHPVLDLGGGQAALRTRAPQGPLTPPPGRGERDGGVGSTPALVAAEPEPERTWAGRLVETSDEWLRRLVADAAPGWTYAGTVAA